MMKNQDGHILYVGKAKKLKIRLKQYFAKSGDEREMIPFLIRQVANIDTIITPSEKEALLLENTLIKRHKPKYNILLKDDKTYISLMINHKHKFPMIRLVRSLGKPKPGNLHFGPFTNTLAARHTLDIMSRLFPMRQCSDKELVSRKRPCLLYSIKKCVAPCVSKCTKDQYDKLVTNAISFLKGNSMEVIASLQKEMEKASNDLAFEKAHALKRTIKQIEEITFSKKAVVQSTLNDLDAISLYRQATEVMLVKFLYRDGRLIGSEHFSFTDILQSDEEIIESFLLQEYVNQSNYPKEIILPTKPIQSLEQLLQEATNTKIHLTTPLRGEKLAILKLAYENAKELFIQVKSQETLLDNILLEMEEKLRLTKCPMRIECFDISCLSGDDLVGSMVTYTNGKYDKKNVRFFKIKTVQGQNDYASLEEILMRHYSKCKENDDLPDLTIIDGGKGQLTSALKIFDKLSIATVDLISLAKEDSKHTKGITRERVFLPHRKEPITLEKNDKVLFLLQKIRDDAHRVAINFQRKQTKKRILKSSLDSLPGIGPIKKKALLKHFGSVKKIKEASQKDLEELKVLNKKDIELLLAFGALDK